MKNKSFFKWIFNPFERIAGLQALGWGFVIIAITSLIGFYSGIAFDGVLDIHFGKLTLFQSFAFPLVSLLCLIICTSLLSLIFTRNFRLIDVIGTLALARTPFLFISWLGFIIKAPNAESILSNPLSIFTNIGFIFSILISIIISIWAIVLNYNALRVSCNLNGSKLAVVLIIGILIAEVLSKITIALL